MIQKAFALHPTPCIFALPFRAHSSVGLEHLPYKQRVRGSNPCAPTDRNPQDEVFEGFLFSASQAVLERRGRQKTLGHAAHARGFRAVILL